MLPVCAGPDMQIPHVLPPMLHHDGMTAGSLSISAAVHCADAFDAWPSCMYVPYSQRSSLTGAF